MLSKLSIRWRLILSFAVVIAIVIGAKVVESYYDSLLETEYRLVRASNRAAINSQQLNVQLLTVESEVRLYVLLGSKKSLDLIEAAKKRFHEIDAMMIETYAAAGESRAQQLAWVQEIGNLFNDFIKNVVDPGIEIRRAMDSGQITVQEIPYRISGLNAGKYIGAINRVLDDLVNTALENVQIEAEVYIEVQRAANMVSMVSIALVVVVSLLIAFFTARYITSRLQMAVGVAEATAGGDLTARIDSSGSDEISHLLQAIAKMQHQLREIFRDFADNSNQLTEQASHLAETAEQLNEASTHQSESSSSMAAAMEELTVSIAHVSNTAEQSAGSARESGEVAGQGRQAVEKTVGSIERIANHIGKTASDVEKLETRASEISAIINVIEEIAEQTNLLALNAAIEAARAGEQGRGFAVVADEVRKLAERTATSTSEITAMIGQIQSGTHEAVQAMKHSVEQVEEGVGLVNETGGLIVSLAESAADVGEQTNDISSALTQQKSASNDLSGNIEQVARMAEENSGRVNDVVEVAAALRELAGHLRDEIARFKIN